MANSADPDLLASSEVNWSGSTLFANAGYIRAQQDQGLHIFKVAFCEMIVYQKCLRKLFL